MGAHLKTEAWYVVENDPGSRIYKGLRGGVTRGRHSAVDRAGEIAKSTSPPSR
jgi:hypothetical protein